MSITMATVATLVALGCALALGPAAWSEGRVVASLAEKVRIEASYRRLADFYEIWLAAIAGDGAFSAKVAAFVRSAEPNPHYAWFLRP